jgi:small subunit ribosomal protein S6
MPCLSTETLPRIYRGPVPDGAGPQGGGEPPMRHYEVMVILDAGLEEEAIRTTIDRATQIVVKGGGTVDKVDRWGKRRFAYEVRHRNEGYYVLITTTAESAVLAEVDRMLGLADEVIRHKVIRLPEGKAVVRASRPSAPDRASAGAKANGEH